MSTKKYLDEDGLLYVKQKITNKFVAKETGKGLSTNDLTNALKQTYDDTVTTVAGLVAEGGEPNVIEIVKVNGSALTPDANKAVDVTVPTKVSDITNDGDGTTGSRFATESYVDTNGGKIDKIKVNNVEQSITNKTVNITVPTNNNELTNGAGYQTASDVSTAISSAISTTYKPAGSVTFANLPALGASNEGKVYNVTDSFTTTSDFVEGAGNDYPAGTNVVIINTTGETYKYDVLAGFVDLSGYVQDSDLVAITNAEIDTIFA